MTHTLPCKTLDRSIGRSTFGADPQGYNSGRLGYPEELFERVLKHAPCATPRTLEIGPGTGLATVDLLDRGVGELIAIEPDRALADCLRAAIADPRLQIIEGGFGDVPLPLDRFDLAVAACSFHWVEQGRGFAQLRRVLRSGGSLALWWHSYRNPMIDPFFDALLPLLQGLRLPPSEGEGGHLYLDRARQHAILEDQGFSCVDSLLYRSDRILDAGAMRALYASFSFVRILPLSRRLRLLDRIADLVDTRFDGSAPNVVLTPLYLARWCPDRAS